MLIPLVLFFLSSWSQGLIFPPLISDSEVYSSSFGGAQVGIYGKYDTLDGPIFIRTPPEVIYDYTEVVGRHHPGDGHDHGVEGRHGGKHKGKGKSSKSKISEGHHHETEVHHHHHHHPPPPPKKSYYPPPPPPPPKKIYYPPPPPPPPKKIYLPPPPPPPPKKIYHPPPPPPPPKKHYYPPPAPPMKPHYPTPHSPSVIHHQYPPSPGHSYPPHGHHHHHHHPGYSGHPPSAGYRRRRDLAPIPRTPHASISSAQSYADSLRHKTAARSYSYEGVYNPLFVRPLPWG